MSDFVYREPAKILRDILVEEMDLDAGQVMLSNQKFNIPTTGLYIVISYVGPSKVLSRMSELQDNGLGGQSEVQSIVMLHLLQIDIMAYNDPEGGNAARTRKEEIAMAISSIYAQQQQEQYAMQIARHPGPFMDTSFLEETEMMTRYTTTLMTTSVNRKMKDTDEYYDTFPGAGLYPDPTVAVVPILAPPVNPVSV